MVRIIKIDQSSDFQLSGNYLNYIISLQSYPKNVLPSFDSTPQLNVSGGQTVSSFKLYPITIKGSTITDITSNAISLTAFWVVKSTGDNLASWFFQAYMDFSTLGLFSGLARYYIKLSDNTEFISEPFCINQSEEEASGRAFSSGFSFGFS